MVERRRTKALLVQVEFSTLQANVEDNDEFHELAVSAGLVVVGTLGAKRDIPDPKYLIGSGKVEEIRLAIQQDAIDLVLINQELTPSQERNLEKALSRPVVDRTRLILEIFAKRARTFEGKLQVELAQLTHLSTRLVRGWTHLERQKGGIGVRGGPGETQLELDRRIIRRKMERVKKKLERVRQQRSLRRARRAQSTMPTISLVGYTNAGKSTLFNALTQADVYVADRLFATLDPTLRQLTLPSFGQVVLADTVGFIRHLPHHLVDAFRATLEETQNAQLLLHIVDAHDEKYRENIHAVNSVLREIGAASLPQLLVFNKIDLLEAPLPRVDRDADGRPQQVWVSAVDGQGLDHLVQAIQEYLVTNKMLFCLKLRPEEGDKRSWLYDMNAILHETYDDEGNALLEVLLSESKAVALLGGGLGLRIED